MKQVNQADFGEVLQHATELGYDWNTIHDSLAKDLLSEDEYSTDWYLSDMGSSNPYGLKEDTIKIVASFMVFHGVEHFTLTR